MDVEDGLTETLREAQRFGFFGPGSIDDAIVHAQQFVEPASNVVPGGRLLDLGSGGGLPGLVIAAARPDIGIVLLDRREKRTDFLSRAIHRLGYEHVDVWCRDARTVAAAIESGSEPAFDAVTARGFGPPEVTLRLAAACVTETGRVVVSEPPSGDRWAAELLRELGLRHRRVGTVAVFERGA